MKISNEERLKTKIIITKQIVMCLQIMPSLTVIFKAVKAGGGGGGGGAIHAYR